MHNLSSQLRSLARLALATSLALLFTSAANAETVSKKVPFELDRWIELDSVDGPVTLHRIRLREVSGGLTKSKIFRPGNDEYLETVQIELEYSNESSRDWEVDIDLKWVDAKGDVIDGYHDEEDLDDDERYDEVSVTLSTLRYGLEHAKHLVFELDYGPN